jgi:hypothetical protein
VAGGLSALGAIASQQESKRRRKNYTGIKNNKKQKQNKKRNKTWRRYQRREDKPRSWSIREDESQATEFLPPQKKIKEAVSIYRLPKEEILENVCCR